MPFCFTLTVFAWYYFFFCCCLDNNLEDLQAWHLASKYVVIFVVNKYTMQPPEIWDGGVGFVTKEMIQTDFPAPASDIKVTFALHISPTHI